MPAPVMAQDKEVTVEYRNDTARILGQYILAGSEETLELEPGRDGRILLKTSDRDEVWALQPMPATRGDLVLRNDVNRIMLRVTAIGGLTYFPERTSLGVPAFKDDSQNPAAMADISNLYNSYSGMAEARGPDTGIVSSIRSVPVEFGGLEAGQHPYAREVVRHVEWAFDDLQSSARTADVTRTVTLISIAERDPAGVSFDGRTLYINITLDEGLAGRPSSERISWVLRRHTIEKMRAARRAAPSSEDLGLNPR